MDSNKPIDLKLVGWILGIVIGLFVLWFLLMLIIPQWIGIEKLGQFGDSFAVVNTLFSALALVAVAVAIVYQRHELKEQKAQYEEQKEAAEQDQKEQKQQFEKQLAQKKREFDAQEKRLKSQEEHQKIKQFESTFFNMLNLLNEIIKNISVTDDNGYTKVGRDALQCLKDEFSKKYSEVDYYYNSKINNSSDERVSNDAAALESLIKTFWDKKNAILGHYFRTLYAILKIIELSELDYKTKKSYSNILRAQLSTYELHLLFFNCLWLPEFVPFRLLIEKYAILEHLNKEEINENPKLSKELLSQYQSNAYGANCPDDMTSGEFNKEKYSDIYSNEKNFIVENDNFLEYQQKH